MESLISGAQESVVDTTIQGTSSAMSAVSEMGEASNSSSSSAPVTGTIAATAKVEGGTDSFIDQVPEEFRGEASLSNIKDLGALVKGYVHAQKELGARIRVPGPGASDEVKLEFAKKMEQAGFMPAIDLKDPSQVENVLKRLGRPDTPDGYDAMVPEDLKEVVNEEQLTEYRTLAHKLGLTKAQAKSILEYDINRTLATLEGHKEKAEATLKSEWGDAFDQRLSLAKEGVTYFEGKFPEAVAAIKNGQLGNNPVVLMMAAELGKMYKESGVVVGNRSIKYGLTPSEARARIDEIRSNSAHAYHNDSDPSHWSAVQEVESLYSAAYPTGGQSN